MTELMMFKTMLIRAGILFDEEINEEINVIIKTHNGPNNEGYVGFECRFIFNLDGKLLRTDIFE